MSKPYVVAQYISSLKMANAYRTLAEACAHGNDSAGAADYAKLAFASTLRAERWAAVR